MLKFRKLSPYGGSPLDYIGGIKAATTLVVKFTTAQKMAWWTKSSSNIITFKEAIKLMSKNKIDYYKRIANSGTNVGRSGGHGTPFIKAGNDLIREANKPGVAKDFAELLKKEGNRLIEKGKGINHKM